MIGSALAQVGDTIHVEESDYRRTVVPAHQDNMGDLHLRVTRIPMDADAYDTEWITVRGVENPTGKPALPEAEYVVRRRALLDREPAAPKGPVW